MSSPAHEIAARQRRAREPCGADRTASRPLAFQAHRGEGARLHRPVLGGSVGDSAAALRPGLGAARRVRLGAGRAAGLAGGRMRLAIADPPYLGRAAALYGSSARRATAWGSGSK